MEKHYKIYWKQPFYRELYLRKKKRNKKYALLILTYTYYLL